MQQNIENILREAYELEGLLLLADQRTAFLPDLLKDAILKKSQSIHNLICEQFQLPAPEPQTETEPQTEPEPVPQPVVEESHEQEDEPVVEEDPIIEEAPIYEQSVEPQPEQEPEPEPEQEPEPEPEQEAEQEAVREQDEEPKIPAMPEPEYAMSPQMHDQLYRHRDYLPDSQEFQKPEPFNHEQLPSQEPAPEPVFQEPQDFENPEHLKYAPKFIQIEEETTDDEPVNEPEPERENERITLNEALQRERAKGDIKKAFSVNDRVRFRRELFGNSDIIMNEMLELINAMHSYEEAEDYFLGDQDWNVDAEEVADFMDIVKKHFS